MSASLAVLLRSLSSERWRKPGKYAGGVLKSIQKSMAVSTTTVLVIITLAARHFGGVGPGADLNA